MTTTVINPWQCETMRIASVRAETPGVATYSLSFARLDREQQYRFQPGQFNMLYVPGLGQVAISLSADPAEQSAWAHTIRSAGNVTRRIAALGAGATLGLRGPYGTSWPLDEARGKDVILVAGGIGLAPLRPAIYALLRNRRDYGQLTLLYGGRSPVGLLYADEYARWSDQGLSLQATVDRSAPGWMGSVGFVNLLLERLRGLRPADTIVLTCGPEVMMRYIVRSALARGMTADQIWCSLERNMQCAVGLCGHCQLGPEFICKDGPVFRYDRVSRFLTIEGL